MVLGSPRRVDVYDILLLAINLHSPIHRSEDKVSLTCTDIVKSFRWGGAIPLLAPAVVVISLASHAYAEDHVLHLGFENGSLAGWHPRAGDEGLIEYSIDEGSRLVGERSLFCNVRTWDEDLYVNNEQVSLRYALDPPLFVNDSTRVSWSWWIGDKRESDGVGLALWLHVGSSSKPLCLSWASHSLYERGAWPYDDPSQQFCRHVESLSKPYGAPIFQDGFPDSLMLDSLEIFFWFPKNQIAYVDEIRIGPPGFVDDMSRAESSHLVTPPEDDFLVADLTGDRKPDVLLLYRNTMPVLWTGLWEGKDVPGERVKLDLEGATSLRQPAVADLDRDGFPDLLGFSGDSLRIYRGMGAGRFRRIACPAPPNVERNRPARLVAADLCGTPSPELLLIRYNGLVYDSIYVHDRPGVFRSIPLPPYPEPERRRGYRTRSIPIDIDRDNDIDLFCTNTDLFLRDGDSLICATSDWFPEIGTHQTGAAFGDIDNDGDLDLFISVDIRNHENEPDVTHDHSLLYRNDGGRFADVSNRIRSVPSAHAQQPVFQDFDLDGDLDLFFTCNNWYARPPPKNVYLENDGTGRFQVSDPEYWLQRMPPASRVASFDVENDGDPDLIAIVQGENRVAIFENPGADRSSIKVLVLDRHGVARADGTHVELFGDGERIGYRQIGAGSARSSWSEAIFGCPSQGPFDLIVTFPSRPESPVVRKNLRPGDHIDVIEPAFPGLWGRLASLIEVRERALSMALSSAGWPTLLPGAIVVGLLFGAVLFANRSVSPGFPVEPGSRLDGAARKAALLIVVPSILAVASSAFFWPRDPSAVRRGWIGLAGMLGGIGFGAAAAYLVSSRKGEFARSGRDIDEARLQLLEAIDGFSHASWLKYLAGVASLCRSVCEGSDIRFVGPRLKKRLDSYGDVIQPQMHRISRLLPRADLGNKLAEEFDDGMNGIESAMRELFGETPIEFDLAALGESLAGAERRLVDLSDRIEEITGVVDRLFAVLGERFRTEAAAEIAAAVDRVVEKHGAVRIACSIPGDLPPVFVVPGELSNILENLITNGARAAMANASSRPPFVSIAAEPLGGLLVLQIRDSGTGFQSSDPDQLFRFRSTDPRTHGRGLPYARRRLELYDGTIAIVSSSREKGTVISVTLRTLESGIVPDSSRRGNAIGSASKKEKHR